MIDNIYDLCLHPFILDRLRSKHRIHPSIS